mmetsp:Transcript_15292/g.38943  ORF Transcript_15292/g.38943 Transcript_15292/m.38943 type:complete len:291 (+) Transcript_15292:1740-2612(+)
MHLLGPSERCVGSSGRLAMMMPIPGLGAQLDDLSAEIVADGEKEALLLGQRARNRVPLTLRNLGAGEEVLPRDVAHVVIERPVERGKAQIGQTQVAVDQRGATEVGLTQIHALHLAVAEVAVAQRTAHQRRAVKDGLLKVGTGAVALVQVALGEHGATQIRTAQRAAAKVAAHKGTAGGGHAREVCLGQRRVLEHAAGADHGVAQRGATQIGALELEHLERELAEILSLQGGAGKVAVLAAGGADHVRTPKVGHTIAVEQHQEFVQSKVVRLSSNRHHTGSLTVQWIKSA